MTPQKYREAFELPSDVTYLNCAFMSPLLKKARLAHETALAIRAVPWTMKTDAFFEQVEKARTLFGGLIGSTGENISIVPSVSYGLAIAARNLPFPRGKHILVLEGEFPSNYYVWAELAKQQKGDVETVPTPADGNWTREILKRINAGTAIVAAPTCHWTDGAYVDLEQVGEKLRSVGGALVVDGSQTLGPMPFDVAKVKPDFYVNVGYKWLLGPYSVSFVYVDEKYHSGEPIEWNWLNREGSEDFSRLCEYFQDYRTGARRFDVGQKSNFLLMPAMTEALAQLREWDPKAMSVQVRSLTDRLAEGALEMGFETIPRENRVGHLIGLRSPKKCVKEMTGELAKKKIYVSARGRSIRVAPNVYNTPEEIEFLLDALKKGCD